MKYSSIKAPNASIYTNQIKNGNKIEKTPNNIQQMELNTIWGLFDKIINNNTKKKETHNAAPLYLINKHELNDTPKTIRAFRTSFNSRLLK